MLCYRDLKNEVVIVQMAMLRLFYIMTGENYMVFLTIWPNP